MASLFLTELERGHKISVAYRFGVSFLIQLLNTHCWRPHPLSLYHPTLLTLHTEWYTSHRTTHHRLTLTLPTSHPHHLPPSPSLTLLLPHPHQMPYHLHIITLHTYQTSLHTSHLPHPHTITLHTLQISFHMPHHPHPHTTTHHTPIPTIFNLTTIHLPIITTQHDTPTLHLPGEVTVHHKLCADLRR